MRSRIKKILVQCDTPLRDVAKVINLAPRFSPHPAPSGIALVIDEQGKLCGVFTDGDLRRLMLRGETDLSLAVQEVMNTKPIAVQTGLSSAAIIKQVTDQLTARGAHAKTLDRVILIDALGRPVDVVSSFELWKENEIGARSVAVIGQGFVGLTLSVGLAEVGYNVIGVENNAAVLASLQSGKPHFFEKNLEKVLCRHLGKRLHFTDQLEESDADIFIISVGTPFSDISKEVDYSHIRSAAALVGEKLRVGGIVLLRSTVPIGTTKRVVIPILEEISELKVGRDFSIAFAPERTVEGRALEELRTLPQIVGGYDERSLDVASRFFRPLASTIVAVESLEAAETVKLLNNTYRDYVFAFSNYVSRVCDKYNISTSAVIKAANEGYPRDPIPKPSPGVGGICLRKDPYLFAASATAAGIEADLPLLTRKINESMPGLVTDKVCAYARNKGIDASKLKVGILGVAFKGHPETSDARGSIAVDVVRELRARGISGELLAYDPLVSAMDLQAAGLTAASLDTVLASVDALLVLTNHRSFETVDFSGAEVSVRYLFDGWNLFNPEVIVSQNMIYDAFGAPVFE